MAILSPTLHFNVEDVAKLPLLEREVEQIKSQVDEVAEEAVAIARADWDLFETSWDFTRLPMLDAQRARGDRENEVGAAANVADAANVYDFDTKRTDADTFRTDADTKTIEADTKRVAFDTKTTGFDTLRDDFDTQSADADTLRDGFDAQNVERDGLRNVSGASHIVSGSVEAAWNRWKQLCDWRINRMQTLETENNRLFIEAYGLQDELASEVPLSQITLMRADPEKDTRRLLSYFIGCLMGRYSLDEPGLIYADAGNKNFDRSRYRTFAADDDGIVPVTDLEWFAADAARQFEQFVRVAFANRQVAESDTFNSVGRIPTTAPTTNAVPERDNNLHRPAGFTRRY